MLTPTLMDNATRLSEFLVPVGGLGLTCVYHHGLRGLLPRTRGTVLEPRGHSGHQQHWPLFLKCHPTDMNLISSTAKEIEDASTAGPIPILVQTMTHLDHGDNYGIFPDAIS